MGIAVQPWNYRAGVHISPRYPTMRNRRIVVTTTEITWDEGADEPERVVTRTFDHPCEPDAYEMQEGFYTAAHVAALAIRKTYYASPVEEEVGFGHHFEEVYQHPYRGHSEVTELTLVGFRPHEMARVRKLVKEG